MSSSSTPAVEDIDIAHLAPQLQLSLEREAEAAEVAVEHTLAEEERLSRGGPPPKCNGTNGVAGVDCIPPNRVRDGPPTVRPAGALAQEDPKAAAKKGDEAAEENNCQG